LLIEKPAAPSLHEGAEMLKTLRARPVPVMVAQTLRYNAVVGALRRLLSEIGRVHAVTLSQRFEPSPLAWLDDPSVSGGGMTLHTGVHLFDLLRLFTARDPESVTCQMQRVHTKRTEDIFAATVQIAAPATLATVSCARTAGGRGGHIELAGERGTLIGDHVLHQASRVVGTKREEIAIGPPVPTVREAIHDFTRAVRGGTSMPIPLTEGLRAVAVVDACYAAARTGGEARVDLGPLV
jgi:predicted dehydrogenase